MSNQFKKTKLAKAIAGFAGLTTGLMMVGGTAFTASAQSIESLQAQIASLLATINTLSAQISVLTGGTTVPTTTVGTGYVFNNNLTIGSTGEDVRQLQILLNSDSATAVALSGVGSKGNETTFYGSLTGAAVIKFQEKYASEILAPVGLTSGVVHFGPSTRAKANTLSAGTGVTGGVVGGTGTVVVPTGTGLAVSLVGSTGILPIPSNVSSMTFATYNFTAGAQGALVSGLTVMRTGLGDKDDFDDVWITANGVKMGTERSLITGDTATFNFGNPMAIPAGTTVVVKVLGSLSSSAVVGHYNALGISAITADVAVSASLPLYGPTTTISSQSATQVTMTTQGSDKSISVGAIQTEVGRFKLDVTSTNDQDIILQGITLENQGTSNALVQVLANVAVKVNGVTISSGIIMDGDLLIINFDDYLMEDGVSQSFIVVADVIGAEVNDTVQLQLSEDSDLTAKEVNTNAGVRVDGEDGSSSTPANNVDLKTYTLETGDVNFSINDATSRNVAPGLDDIVLLDGTLIIDSAITADGIKVRLASGTDTNGSANLISELNADLENITLKIDGITVDTVDTLTNADGAGTTFVATGNSTADYYDFDSTFTLEPGTHNITVEADVKTGATTGDKVKLILLVADMDSPEYIVSGDTVPSTELTGQVQGSLVTIQKAELTVTLNDGFSGEKVVGGADMVTIMEFTIDANDSSDVSVSSMTFEAGNLNVYSASFVTNMQLYIDGVAIGSPVDLSSGNISDANFTIPQSQQVQATLKVDTNTVTSSANLEIELVDMDAFDVEGNTVTVMEGGATLSTTNDLSSSVFSVTTGGTFTLAIDGDTPDEDILIGDGGSIWYPIATYRLTAEDEDIKLTNLFLVNATSTDFVTASLTAGRVQSLGVFDENGVLKGTKTLSSGLVEFDLGDNVNASGLGAIVVPADDFTKITIRAKLNSIVDADKSGSLLRLVVDGSFGATGKGVIAQSTSTGDDLATGSITVAADLAGTASDYFVLRRTRPMIDVVAQSGGDTVLTDGSSKVIYRFTVSADANEDIAWKGVKFDITGRFGSSTLSAAATDGELDTGGATGVLKNFQLYETSNNTEVQNGNYAASTTWDGTDLNGEVSIVMNNNFEEVVGAGASKSYELRTTVTGASVDGNFVDVAIDSEADDKGYVVLQASSDPDRVDGTDNSTVNMLAGTAANPYTFLWSDNSGSPHSLANDIANADELDWTNDRFIDIDNQSWNRQASF